VSACSPAGIIDQACWANFTQAEVQYHFPKARVSEWPDHYGTNQKISHQSVNQSQSFDNAT